MRNPWARMLSWWRMFERTRSRAAAGAPWSVNRLHGPEANAFWAEIVQTPDFRTFVMQATDEWTRLRRPQVSYLTTQDRLPDLIGRQESLEADLRAVVARYDLPRSPLAERSNADPSPTSYREHYDDEMRDRVADLFATDIRHFTYRF